jgi:hyaluronoglucosaminidase
VSTRPRGPAWAAWTLALATALGVGGCSAAAPRVGPPPGVGGSGLPGGAASPFAVRGVVEGFYGPPWTAAATADLLAFLGAHGMNTFVYAPKDDPYQRAQWRRPYPEPQLQALRGLVQDAARHGVTFVYSVSPGLDITYSSAADRAALEAKLAQLRGIGVRAFMLSFDDIPARLQSAADVAAYGGDLAAAQADLIRAVFAALRRQDPQAWLLVTPTEYAGTAADPYLRTLARLPQPIDLVWTGPGVVSPQVTLADARAFAAVVGRRPVLWYNYPVNDWTIPPNQLAAHLPGAQPRDLFLGPVRGLDPQLPEGVRGVLANPMLEPYASELPLASLAAYLQDPGAPAERIEEAWRVELTRAGQAVAPALATFCASEQPYPQVTPQGRYTWSSTDPATDTAEAQLLDTFARDPAAAVRSAAQAQLRTTFRAWMAAAPDLAPGRLPTAGLAADLAPWVRWLPAEGQAGLDALRLLERAAAGDASGTAAARAAVQADLELLSTEPVEFGGHLQRFLEGALRATA